MKNLLRLIIFGLLLTTSFAYAGHDFRATMQQISTLVKQESCSNGRTIIEHRQGKFGTVDFFVVFVVREPGTESRNSPFYHERNKDFYSTIFYQLRVLKQEEKLLYWIKESESGDLQEADKVQWLEKLRVVDFNAAANLANKSGSDCVLAEQNTSQ